MKWSHWGAVSGQTSENVFDTGWYKRCQIIVNTYTENVYVA